MRLNLVTILFLSLAFNQNANAQTPSKKYEIWSGSLGHLGAYSMAESVNFQASLLGSSLGTGLLSGVPIPSLGIHFERGIELILTPSFNWIIPQRAYSDQPTDGSTLTSRLTAGIAYNFSEDLQNSGFIRLDSGVTWFQASFHDAIYYVGSIHGGKRFALSDCLSLTPSLSAELVTSSPHVSFGVTATFLQVSVHI